MIKFLFLFVLTVSIYNSQMLQISDSEPKKSHPFFVTVTEMRFNPAEEQLQISCKIFSDDLEKALRKTSADKVDLLNPFSKPAMDSMVAKYLRKHLEIKIDGQPLQFDYIGYEQEDDAVFCYMQIDSLSAVKKVEVINDLLFGLRPQQTNLVHVTVAGTRKSARLNNPVSRVTFQF